MVLFSSGAQKDYMVIGRVGRGALFTAVEGEWEWADLCKWAKCLLTCTFPTIWYHLAGPYVQFDLQNGIFHGWELFTVVLPFLCSVWYSLWAKVIFWAHSLTHSLTRSLAHSLTRSLAHSLTRLLTHSLTHSLACSLAHSLTHSLILTDSFSLTHSLSHWLTHSLTHSLDSDYFTH